LVFATKKTDRHDITEILLKVALNTISDYPLLQLVFCYNIAK
jgi:cobalamin-dependent methionine synthase I